MPANRTLRVILGVSLLGLAVILAMQLWYLMHVILWREVDPSSTSFMRQQLEVLRERNPKARLQHRWVPYDKVSVNLKRAVIASEDSRFPDHDGVDWEAIERAFEKNTRRGRVAFGGSTITMQLAKNLFLSGDRSYLRKAQELVIAYMLEAMMSKRAHPRDLPERRGMGRGGVRCRGRGPALLRRVGRTTQPGPGGAPGGDASASALL